MTIETTFKNFHQKKGNLLVIQALNHLKTMQAVMRLK